MSQKYLILLPFCFLLASAASAQSTLPNAGFENWEPSGSPPPFNWEQPEGWKTSNEVTEFTAAAVNKSTDSYSGTYAAKVKTLNIFGIFQPGILLNGSAIFNDLVGPVVDYSKSGTPVSVNPTSLNFYYKFTSSSANDSAYVKVLLKKWNAATNKTDTIAESGLTLPQTAAYTFTEVPLEALQTPDTLLLVFYSSKLDNVLEGGELFVDEVNLGAAVGGVDIGSKPGTTEAFFHPNPLRTASVLRFANPDGERHSLKLYDSMGRMLLEKSGMQHQMLLERNGLPTGVYLFVLSRESGVVQTGKLLVE